jgi:hypothetical protein
LNPSCNGLFHLQLKIKGVKTHQALFVLHKQKNVHIAFCARIIYSRVGPWQLPGGRNSGRKWQLPFSATSIQVANWPAEKRKWQK